ncbi:hypothetical protein MKW98_018147 [Papaver atlanticum]|uniref:Poly(A) RNA polymerase mitochondrial-like central palm domain-containing protein n=1 Tax=Papaver atlanticum TaxID=357466 RepID=A0AAD4XAC0_9MAGN|nr:hypothetical protein MKW98_018147 [Papaver atlanticum]
MSFYNNSSSSTSNSGVLLEISLSEILLAIKPSEDDVTARTQIINELKATVGGMRSQNLRGASVELFGSFVSNLYTRWGDLDISVQLPDDQVYNSTALRDIKGALQRRGIFHIVDFIPEARVPILAVASNRNNIHCDISINNWKGLINSKFLSWITQIDGRFRDMVLLIKEWAKSRDINSPKDGTLNSYSLSLLVIFHFQTCEPAIFPPLKEIYAGNIVKDFRGGRLTVTEERNIHDTCNSNIERFRRNLTNVNKSSVSELFVSFFQKFSTIKTMASDRVICTYSGQWEQKRNYFRRSTPLLIEDPIDRPENAARAVMYMSHLDKISEACEETYQKLLSVGCDKTSLISSLVSREVSSKILI